MMMFASVTYVLVRNPHGKSLIGNYGGKLLGETGDLIEASLTGGG